MAITVTWNIPDSRWKFHRMLLDEFCHFLVWWSYNVQPFWKCHSKTESFTHCLIGPENITIWIFSIHELGGTDWFRNIQKYPRIKIHMLYCYMIVLLSFKKNPKIKILLWHTSLYSLFCLVSESQLHIICPLQLNNCCLYLFMQIKYCLKQKHVITILSPLCQLHKNLPVHLSLHLE